MAAGYEARARVTADMSGFVSAANQATSATNAMATAVQELNTQLRSMQRGATRQSTEIQNLSQQTARSSQAARSHTSATQAAAEAARQGAEAYNSASAGAQRYHESTEASTRSTRQNQRQQEQLSGGLRAMAQTHREQQSAVRESSRAAADFNGSLWSMRSAVQDVGSSMQQLWMVSVRATQGLWDNFSAQEMTIAQISRVSQATVTEMDAIVGSVRQMSTEIPIAFDELGRIAMLGSQVGVANESLETFTETVALFSATSEVTADQTATLMARIMEMTNLNQTHGQESVQNLGSAVAYLGSNMVATDQEILTTIESIATMTTQAGMTAEATIGLGAAMASLRIRPEIARGATQRVFLQLSEAVDGTSSEMQRLTEITGMTQTELQNLRDTDFDAYFMTIMESLSATAEAGEDLVPVLRQIGILNSRDAEVVARLAANYDVLAAGVENAGIAFENGNYLYEESGRIFETLTARLQLLRNTWHNFMFSAVEAIAPFLIAVMDAATGLIEMADAMGLAPWLGFGAAVLGVVGGLGLLASMISNVGAGWLAIQGTLNLLTGQTAANTAATTANTGAMAANTAATTAGATAKTRFATATGVATAALRAFSLVPVIGALVGLASILTTVRNNWHTLASSTEAARSSVLRVNEAHISAAGGLDSLRNALESDTEAWRNAQEHANAYINDLDSNTSAFSSAAEDIIRNSRFRMQASQEMSEADREAAEAAEGLAERQQGLRDELDISSESFSGASDSASELAGSTEELVGAADEADNSIGKINQTAAQTEQAMRDTAYAVGLATRQWAALSLESAIAESELLSNAEAFEMVKSSGVDFGTALTLEMQQAGDGVLYLDEKFDEFYNSLPVGQRLLGSFTNDIYNLTGGFINLRTDTGVAIQAFRDAETNLQATTYSIEEAARATELLDEAFIKMPDGTRATQEELALLAETGSEAAAVANMLNVEVDALGVSISTLHEGFASFIDPLQVWKDTLEAAGVEVDGLGASLDQVDGGFSTYLDNLEESQRAQMEWGQNLLELAEVVPPEVLGGLTEMGVEGAGLVQDLVDATDDEVDRFVELWEAGTGDAAEQWAIMFSDFVAMARDSGDQGGVDFANNLMDQVANGDISFREAVNAMTEYAKGEFEGADPTMEAHLESTQAMIDLTKAIERMRRDAANAEPTAEVDVNTSRAIRALASFSAYVASRPIIQWVVTRVDTRGHGRVPKYQDGGWIEGPGGPRQDNIPIMASPGEFVVNARAAAMFSEELEQMNAVGLGRNTTSSVPSFVPENIMEIPRVDLSNVQMSMPHGMEAAMRNNSVAAGPRMVINVYNTYPQAEPTSVTVNRSLAYAAALDGV